VTLSYLAAQIKGKLSFIDFVSAYLPYLFIYIYLLNLFMFNSIKSYPFYGHQYAKFRFDAQPLGGRGVQRLHK
jgi:hypothetical protein